MTKARHSGSISPAEMEAREARSTIANEELRTERKRLVRLGLIAGNGRADARERSDYLNQKIRQASGLE
jgi:hypothetical protein